MTDFGWPRVLTRTDHQCDILVFLCSDELSLPGPLTTPFHTARIYQSSISCESHIGRHAGFSRAFTLAKFYQFYLFFFLINLIDMHPQNLSKFLIWVAFCRQVLMFDIFRQSQPCSWFSRTGGDWRERKGSSRICSSTPRVQSRQGWCRALETSRIPPSQTNQQWETVAQYWGSCHRQESSQLRLRRKVSGDGGDNRNLTKINIICCLRDFLI